VPKLNFRSLRGICWTLVFVSLGITGCTGSDDASIAVVDSLEVPDVKGLSSIGKVVKLTGQVNTTQNDELQMQLTKKKAVVSDDIAAKTSVTIAKLMDAFVLKHAVAENSDLQDLVDLKKSLADIAEKAVPKTKETFKDSYEVVLADQLHNGTPLMYSRAACKN